MGNDRGQHPGPSPSPSRGRIGGSSVLTPPTGIHVVPDDARALREVDPQPVAASDVVCIPFARIPSQPAVAAPPDVPALVAPAPTGIPCRCGHGPDAHRHWRRGRDCGTCGAGSCTAYRAQSGALRRMLRGVGLIR